MRSIRTPLLALPFLAASSAALAHAHLQTAEPAVDGAVARAPAELAINFTEALEPAYSGIEVTDAQGQRVDRNDGHTAPGNAKRFLVGLPTLQPGTYTVRWHATSVDTHKTDGTYHFTIRP